MGRIRTLKPDFFRSRSMSRCTRDARLTFAGLWCEADDAGRGEADPRLLKGSIWPLDDDVDAAVIGGHLDELERTGHIRRYEVDGDGYYLILKWEKHQAAAYRRGEPKHPAPPRIPPLQPLHDDACKEVQSASNGVLEGKGVDGKGTTTTSQVTQAGDPNAGPSSSLDIRELARLLAEEMWPKAALKHNIPIGKHNRWVLTTSDNIVNERGEDLRHVQAIGLSVAHALDHLMGRNAPAAIVEAWYADPSCDCGGDGWQTLQDNTFGPCDCRQAEPYELATVHQLHEGKEAAG
jgi:hypothetical protein